MVDFARMLALDDPRWTMMTGGYRLPFDPRPLLSRLEPTTAPGRRSELWTNCITKGTSARPRMQPFLTWWNSIEDVGG